MPYCQGCGGNFEDQFSFCPYCGREKPKPPEVSVDVNIKRKKSANDCPICDDNINTQKASSIVASGTKGSLIKNTTNELAFRLEKPTKPVNAEGFLGCGLAGFLLLGSLLFLIIVIVTDGPPICTGFSVIGILISLFLLWAASGEANENKKKLKSYPKALAAWELLYYCHKCDIVFLKGHEEFDKSQNATKACYRWGDQFFEYRNE